MIPYQTKRWSTLETPDDWNDRYRYFEPDLKQNLPVLDIGCGTRFLSTLVGEENYVGVDGVPDHGANYVVNLDVDQLPKEAFVKDGDAVQSVSMVGFLEYIREPLNILMQLAENGVERIYVTYTPTDFVSDLHVRAENDWNSHLTWRQFETLLNDAGYEAAELQKFGNQLLIHAVREGSSDAVENNVQAPAVIESGKPRLVLAGFFGRGNVGDEAMLQRQYEVFSPEFDITIAVEERGAFDGFWNWYPYNQCQIIDHANLAHFAEKNVVGLHVGGGGLPLSFYASGLLTAQFLGKKTALTGIDLSDWLLAGDRADEIAKNYTKPLDMFSVRTKIAQKDMSNFGLEPTLGADWALDLEYESFDEFDGVTLVIRETDPASLDRKKIREVNNLLRVLERDYGAVRLLPFSPEDERFLDCIDGTWGMAIERCWWNPRHVKGLLQSSRYVVSLGRLHAFVLAMEGVGEVACVDTTDMTGAAQPKLVQNCAEYGVNYFETIQSFVDARENRFGRADYDRAALLERLSQKHNALRKIFLS